MAKLKWMNPDFHKRMREVTREQMKDKRKPFICVENGITYQSTRQAATILNLDPSSITKVLRGKLLQTHGYTFQYVAGITPKCHRKRPYKSKIKCIETGNEYPTIQAASQSLNISASMLSDVLLGKRETAKGLHFTRF